MVKGSFLGHFLPGLLAMGIGWTTLILAIDRFLRAKHDSRAPGFKANGNFLNPMEGPVPFANMCVKWFILTSFLFGIFVGVYEIGPSFEFSNFENFQHIIMYLWNSIFIGLDLLYPNSDIYYPSLIVASANESYLFTYHIHGTSTLERVTHWCLAMTSWASSISTTVEYFSSKDLLLPALVRGIAFAW